MTRPVPVTISDLLAAAVRDFPDAFAVRDDGGRYTYGELAMAMAGAAARLQRLGVGRDDRVVVQAVASRPVVVLVYACAAIGAAFVPLHPSAPVPQRRQVIEDAEPALVVLAATEADSDGPPTVSPEEFAGVAADGALHAGPINGDDLALLLYTSGTTSPRPKAVVSRHRHVMFAAAMIASCLRYRHDDVLLCRLPLSFDYGLFQVFLCALAGAELVLCHPEADSRLVPVARAAGVTVLPVVPGLAIMVLRLLERDAGALPVRLITNAGEELPASTVLALRDRPPGAAIQLVFGMTDGKRISILEPGVDLTRPGSVGQAIPVTAVAVVDAGGRRDQLFKLGGMRVSTVELEAVARDVPGVRDAVVLPPAGQLDAAPVAATDLPAITVLRAMRDRLSPEKVPRVCHPVPDLPRTGNGKIDRVAVAVAVGRPA